MVTPSVEWITVVGLEIHAQIQAKTKLFSDAKVSFASPPNTNVSLLDCSIPGTLPVLNQACVDAAVKTGLSLGCKPNLRSSFDRKHYFYFDQPNGYQITQLHHPVVGEGKFVLRDGDISRTVRLERIQLEQDTGKSIHTENRTLIDLNRAGSGLMEIVTYPDLRSGEEASFFVKAVQSILREIGTCDGNMAEGSLRVDANVSVHKQGDKFGTRVEIKNVNGTRHLRKAIEHESKRQVDLIQAGEEVSRETRMFHPKDLVTMPLRAKEVVRDYRFMPEPDIPAIVLTEDYITQMKATLPHLSRDKASFLAQKYNLSVAHSFIIADDAELMDCYESIAISRNAASVGKWFCSEILGALNNRNMKFSHLKEPVDNLSSLYDLVHAKEISTQVARQVFQLICDGDTRAPIDIITKNKWNKSTDKTFIRQLCEETIAENDDIATIYKSGKEHVFKALIGKAMKRGKGKADAKTLTAELRDILNNQ
eukprot:CFRG5374T1